VLERTDAAKFMNMRNDNIWKKRIFYLALTAHLKGPVKVKFKFKQILFTKIYLFTEVQS